MGEQQGIMLSEISQRERQIPYGFFPRSSVVKESACNAGDLGSTSGSGKSPGDGNGNPLQFSCLVNPTDREAWQATVHESQESNNLVTKPTLIHLTHMWNNKQTKINRYIQRTE